MSPTPFRRWWRAFYHRHAVGIFAVVVILAGTVAWGYQSQRQADQARIAAARVAERRRNDSVLCTFLNDTRADIRGVIQDGQNTATLQAIIAALPPDLLAALRGPLTDSRKESQERAGKALQRLADYDCAAFIRGAVPPRPTVS